MPEKKGTTARKGAFSVDTDLVRELADILADTGLTEIEVEDEDRKIRVSRAAVASAPTTHVAPAPAAAPAPSADVAAPALAADAPVDLANAVKSPMVGTAYLASDPGSPNFVKVGDSVKAGDTLLIVEAMKVMNPITATKDGTVKEMLIGNGEPVEFDQPLAIVA
ncbi:acetyl-CoA carboxylase biotin carboxyl carrier protein [Aurantiacibacter rhizosphaerae]|uniref:Biotin carboxyl carrier protein of acetyl-CoA carboxylase n=1 Tax=Aurantiacibacter rhizosphaerae TaxID=2691582 RepID=A0A844XHB1_9SPHN|nr:acetyl-CoA carboxylase biotin carboxyl carrier protein [Aurantiacibacter rhizosphaerae]MWV29396.1 acetyl-CoA carboxylase biotin carboxyl carrier protein [Aurantiacibacter rhizosphaerae]